MGKAWGSSLPTDWGYHDPGGVFCDPLSSLEGTLGLSLGVGIFVHYGKGLYQTFFKCHIQQISEELRGII